MYTTYIDRIKHNAYTVIKTYKYSEIVHKTIGIGHSKKQSLSIHEKELSKMGYNCCGQNTIYVDMT